LRQAIAAGGFREDLYYRLCGATLLLPSLRERQDLDYLIALILEEEAREAGVHAAISDEALALLRRYHWPGNIRQLRNVLRYGLALCDEAGILSEHLPPELSAGLVPATTVPASATPHTSPAAGVPTATARSPQAERLQALLQAHRWNITAVAAKTGQCRTTIYRQMKRFGIVSPVDASSATD
jgi:transcriptional regulator of acetoin/glycerol metabolism